ncbi:transcription factor Pcc1-domain-containing protein [Phlyctochytrium arcticum]|nr:transcription factor Pcc1-domain-containing protein [Phlyctochytrium arcticum]
MSELAHIVTLRIPFPSPDLATVAQKALQVDRDLKAHESTRELNVDGNVLVVVIRAVSIKILRTMVSGFLDFALLLTNTMGAFADDALAAGTITVPS